MGKTKNSFLTDIDIHYLSAPPDIARICAACGTTYLIKFGCTRCGTKPDEADIEKED
jgi:hypothetical protein